MLRTFWMTLALCCSGGPVYAQGNPGFLAMDIFGGYTNFGHGYDEGEPQTFFPGWDFGSTVRFQPWWGFKGEVARTSGGDARQWQYLGGVEFTTPIVHYGFRLFANAQGGYIADRTAGVSQGSPEVVLGGGIDVWMFVRLQVDYARVNLTNRPRNNGRVFFGGVVPLCFRGCRPDEYDGIHVGSN